MKSNIPLSILSGVVRIAFILIAVFYIYKGALICYDYGYRVFTEPAIESGKGTEVTVEIPEGMSAFKMGKLFLEDGLVRDDKLFVLQYYLSEYRKDLKAGSFTLNTNMTVEEMFEVMAGQDEEEDESSESVKTYKEEDVITYDEGEGSDSDETEEGEDSEGEDPEGEDQ
ncbi:MAG: aminodeoxychorismate lyase [Lachnospiraceae bacterium]|nr:aminodeoxychorismate lyase [Lachnospiraceae bacterium]